MKDLKTAKHQLLASQFDHIHAAMPAKVHSTVI